MRHKTIRAEYWTLIQLAVYMPCDMHSGHIVTSSCEDINCTAFDVHLTHVSLSVNANNVLCHIYFGTSYPRVSLAEPQPHDNQADRWVHTECINSIAV